MLIAVAFRNLIELSGTEFDFTEAFVLPQSFGWSRGGNIVWRIFSVRVLAKFLRSVLTLAHVARYDCAFVGVGRGLAEARIYHQI